MALHRKVLVLVVLVAAAAASGCLVGGVASGGTAYVVEGPQMTKRFTNISNTGGMLHVEDAVRTWLIRGQLPLPVMDEGVHEFSIRTARWAKVTGARGGRVVQVCDGEEIVAEYTVAWDKVPVEYRLVSATNMLYAGELDVSEVPVLRTYNVE